MTVLEDFYFWITGIEEDDPLPYEIKYVYFALSFKNNMCCLSYGGNENYDEIVTSFEYFPLEAQFFKNEDFNQIIEINLAKLEVKQLLDDCFKNLEFKKIFEGKKIFICEIGKENIEYSI